MFSVTRMQAPRETLEATTVGDGRRAIGTFDGDGPVRIAPFDAIEIPPPWE